MSESSSMHIVIAGLTTCGCIVPPALSVLDRGDKLCETTDNRYWSSIFGYRGPMGSQ